jgi:hypothetical protein
VQRLQHSAVGKDKDKAHTEVERHQKPTEPRESHDCGQNAAGLKFLAKAKIPPLRLLEKFNARWKKEEELTYSRNSSSDDPEHPDNKQSNEFSAEG